MDSSFLLTICVAAIGFFVLYRRYRSEHENKEDDTLSSFSSLCLSSPPLSRNWTHDVFPSFRGEDVRKDFLSHVQKGFERKGIRHFNDHKIERGESISYELVRAIRGSRISLVVLSMYYASSKWCLEELVEIMKCRRDFDQIVIAIFYKVDPCHVRKLTGDFGKVFRKTCVGKTKEQVRRWRIALVEVATIAGYDSSNWVNEAIMVENIATDVSKKLTRSTEFNDLVGMGAHLETIKQLLCLHLDEVRMVAIWGLPGIGKSTVTKLLYNQLSQRFDGSLYIKDIKTLVRPPCSDEFKSLLTNQNDNKVFNLSDERERLRGKKVLLVIDNVDRSQQLDAIMREALWCGPGSRIIIAVQDIHVLKARGISYMYEMVEPSDYEALQIFCMAAFGQKFPKDGYEDLARKVCDITGTLPRRLKLMGFSLRGVSRQEWIDIIDQL